MSAQKLSTQELLFKLSSIDIGEKFNDGNITYLRVPGGLGIFMGSGAVHVPLNEETIKDLEDQKNMILKIQEEPVTEKVVKPKKENKSISDKFNTNNE